MRKTLLLLLAVLSFNLYAVNSFLVAPTSAEIKLDRPTTLSFVVTNNGDSKIRISVSPIFFPVGSKFMPPLKQIGGNVSGYDDISKNMVVSPKVVSLGKGEQRTVRVSVRPPAGLKDGEYRAHVLFAMLDVANSVLSKKNGEGFSMRLDFKSETAVVVYGSVGSGDSSLETACSVAKNKTKVSVKNNGLWRFDGWLTIYDAEKKDKKLVEEKVFMTRETSKDMLLNWSPSANQKIIKIDWVPLDEKKKRTTTTCNIT